MKSFDIQSSLDDIYARYPEATRQPVIGLTGNFADGDARLCEQYYMSVVRAGGTPVIIPPVADKDVIINTLDKIDGLVLTGGGDINPLWAGEEPSPRLHGINHMRDKAELLTVRLAYNRQIPMLGICRGIQTLVTALDGEVDQDIAESFAAAHGAGRAAAAAGHSLIKHSQDADRSEPTHTVRISRESVLYSLYKTETLAVNSIHHQAVRASGRRFSVSAKAPDGVIEAIESSEFKPFIGVQWHPEWLGESGQVLFRWLVDRARDFYTAKDLHRRMLTLDTHCDTPMFFPQGIHFDQRDPRILVDMHKMAEGHQDAVIMAAYLPQPKLGETFSSKVAFKVDGPLQYADLIFDKIEEIVNANNRYLSIARTPSDLYEDKRKGRRSIMLAIENGLALNHDISNVRYFARRGVVYITLCHNGDNDICDSARGCNTHGGVSRFGEQVIKEMNRCGIMVDLSHAGEKSFYDALSISSKPIVCSHSNCKALCDVPRNLTDDQLRALAKHGGVAHITLYHGFLRNDSQEATVMDAIAHLEHAISIMGIEHVGLGTDFDGDGGIRGLADSSELINFTLHLLRRRYSERDIARIWGGNWLRVMAQVQQTKMF
ncbi:membrane dipeptidase [Xylanibacter rarus]|uniref:membrane dipeptidase n=1 Tax=Xylanibacter rarus TaxID=1676614 RepID=UPI003520FF2A